MAEKYKIYIPEEMKMRLTNDAELFEFKKKDGSINLNGFLKELLINYFDIYREKRAKLLSTITADLASLDSVSKKDADTITKKILNTYIKTDTPRAERSAAITLTVSGQSQNIMRSIENNLLTDSSMSQYINDLFTSYLSISRNKREEIIFHEVFDEVRAAISNHSIITFSSTSVTDLVFTVRPYIIAPSKEEQCNYLLCVDRDRNFLRTFRISRIRALFTTSEIFAPDEDTRLQLQEIASRSPQSASKSIKAEVHLTDRGVHKFDVIVKNRPDVLRKEGNVYYFDWPKHLLEEYFRRFGYDAIIVSPPECSRSMVAFYGKSLDAYKKNLQ